jgi:hypothetical protein
MSPTKSGTALDVEVEIYPDHPMAIGSAAAGKKLSSPEYCRAKSRRDSAICGCRRCGKKRSSSPRSRNIREW